MRKKARIVQEKVECNAEDRISALPDDIIVYVLSRLTLKDAVITSTLSKRWRYMWTYLTKLDFDDSERLDRVAADPKVRDFERPKYINWVNRVIRQYRGPMLDAFKICFDLDKSSKSAVDNWIKFAILMRVQRLELDFLENGEILRHSIRNYAFPCKFLTQGKWSCSKRLYPNLPLFLPCNSTGSKCLKMLTLKCVNVNEEDLNCLFSNCPSLDHLSIHGSGELVNVKVTGRSLALKYLEIVFCLGLQSIKICDTNLASFTYMGPGVDLAIENVPMLDDISIGVGCSGLENNVFGQLACCLHQLEILTLDMYRPDLENIKYYPFPQLPNLRQLILKVGAWGDDCLLEFASWVQACPHLHKFVLQIIWMSPLRRRRKIRHAAKCPHKHLTLVEIVGYFGRISDAELAMYFFENAVALKKIVIDPRNQIIERGPVRKDSIKREEVARAHAKKQLEPQKPPGVRLVIL